MKRPVPMLIVALSLSLEAPLLAQAAAPPPSDKPPAATGEPIRYRLRGEPDVASWLLLWPSGRFEYMLSAGALDEQAAGRWVRTADTIRLTTLPKPQPAQFSLTSAEHAAGKALDVKVTWPDGRGIAGIDLRVTFQDGDMLTAYTQEDGWSLPEDDKRVPRSLELAVTMHGLRSKPVPVDVTRANRLTFLLTPNQLGIADFEDLPISVSGEQLVMHRDGGTLTYRAEKGAVGD